MYSTPRLPEPSTGLTMIGKAESSGVSSPTRPNKGWRMRPSQAPRMYSLLRVLKTAAAGTVGTPSASASSAAGRRPSSVNENTAPTRPGSGARSRLSGWLLKGTFSTCTAPGTWLGG